MIDLDTALMTLSQVRPIFHSEADFQHALAWQIHTQDPHARVRLEYRPLPREAMHLDIWAQGRDDALAIELKYLTEPLVIQHNGERFSLTNHSAQDQRRYDFVSDIVRLEHVVETLSLSNVTGYAVLLTNHGGYWATPSPYWTSAIDTAFAPMKVLASVECLDGQRMLAQVQ